MYTKNTYQTQMNKSINFQKNLLIFGVPSFIILALVIVTHLPIFATNTEFISLGITADLLLTVPLVYFLLIRKTNIPKTTVIPFLIIGIIVCSYIIPTENQYYLSLFKTWVFPVVEMCVLAYVIYNVRKGIKRYKSNRAQSFDFFSTLKTTCHELLPKLAAKAVAMEISVFYYGFIYWKKRKLASNEFSYHKDSGTITILIAVIGIVAIETVGFHVFISRWSETAAWIFTFISIYSGIQIFGFMKSMLKRPISIENNQLHLRYGIMSETTIDIENIESIELSSSDFKTDTESRKLSVLGDIENHNLIIRLKEENILKGLYGIKRTYKNLALHVDDKKEFKKRLENTLL